MTVASGKSPVLEYNPLLNRKIVKYPFRVQGGAEHGKAL